MLCLVVLQIHFSFSPWASRWLQSKPTVSVLHTVLFFLPCPTWHISSRSLLVCAWFRISVKFWINRSPRKKKGQCYDYSSSSNVQICCSYPHMHVFELDLYYVLNMRKYCMDFLFAKNIHFLIYAQSQQQGCKFQEHGACRFHLGSLVSSLRLKTC